MSTNPSSTDQRRNAGKIGGHILVESLRAHGADLAFAVPGESYLAVLDGLVDAPEIKTIVCRQEGGAAMMAEAYGKLTGKPGICMVTRGPGATNASAGVHIAMQDSTPMILLVGQVGREMFDREAFQELDYRRMFGQMAKWVAQIDDPARIPEYVSRAFHVATSGRPGPVVLALPEDMLTERAETGDFDRYKRTEPHVGADDMARFRDLLSKAKKPLVIVGGGGWDAGVAADVARFAEANNLPVGASFRCQDYLDNRHPNYVGHVGIGIDPKLGARVRDSDLLIVVGSRLGEMTTSGYTLLEIPRPRQGLVHVHAGSDELGQVYQGDLLINASQRSFFKAAAAMEPVDSSAWAEDTKVARSEYEATRAVLHGPGDVQMSEIVKYLDENLPEDSIVTNGAGNYATWVHRYYGYKGWRTCLAPTCGSMGYGVPAGVAAKLVHPERTVISFNGDGCYMMHGQELATAVQYGVNTIFIVVNNGMYGTIRMHQEREYPGRVSATGLKNPDFAALARAYGAHGETVTRTADFAAAFERAKAAGTPALIEIQVDPEALTIAKSLSSIRETALADGR
ncbi:thiamine pyrophosphate-binding protein [Thalassobaculum sp. OXR-137]|uniref:thiamine pyrophosphate-binding protein n=1 Tax=Thalassobaculum sp. OXR-137 TaxID=3100173 RepID=UPI002AC8AF0F|nr:thiamine pyrophosphate-binding protein [Thalassobaculum sp. OXR-137]WPZ33383.1 thiamine pyrophosphate-binding protein [Thalassobaculum sp. OXR-137]